jgi:hypothetical protein
MSAPEFPKTEEKSTFLTQWPPLKPQRPSSKLYELASKNPIFSRFTYQMDSASNKLNGALHARIGKAHAEILENKKNLEARLAAIKTEKKE